MTGPYRNNWSHACELAGGREYVYVLVSDYTHAVYARPLCLKSEAVEAFNMFRAAEESESRKWIQEITTDNTRK